MIHNVYSNTKATAGQEPVLTFKGERMRLPNDFEIGSDEQADLLADAGEKKLLATAILFKSRNILMQNSDNRSFAALWSEIYGVRREGVWLCEMSKKQKHSNAILPTTGHKIEENQSSS